MKIHTAIRRSVLAVGTLALASASQAALVITFQEVGGNVVETGSGSANLAAVGPFFPNVSSPTVWPGHAVAIVGNAAATSLDLYMVGTSGPLNFGGGFPTVASSGTGSTFGLGGSIPQIEIVVPHGYVSGTFLSGSSTFNAATFASLGMNTGTFTYTWGTGVNADSLTAQVGPASAAVPEPGSALAGMAALGVCLSGVVKRSRQAK